MACLLPVDLLPEPGLGPHQPPAELRRLGQDHELGGLVATAQVWHAFAQRVECVLEVDPALALQGVVEVAHVARAADRRLGGVLELLAQQHTGLTYLKQEKTISFC